MISHPTPTSEVGATDIMEVDTLRALLASLQQEALDSGALTSRASVFEGEASHIVGTFAEDIAVPFKAEPEIEVEVAATTTLTPITAGKELP